MSIVPVCPNDICGSRDFFQLLYNLLYYFVFTLAVPVATIAIAYAGITMASQPKEEAKRTKAKEILFSAVIGLALVLGAWLIVNTIFRNLASPDTVNQIEDIVPQPTRL